MKTNDPDPDPLEVGARIRALRHESGLSQTGLAKLLEVTPGAVGNWEQGQVNPTIRQALKIRRKFGVSLDYIYCGEIQHLAQGRAALLRELEGLKHDPTGPNLGRRRP